MRLQENVWKGPAETLLAKPEQTENQGHLQGVGEYGEQASAYGCVAHPEGGEGIPQNKGAVVESPHMP